MLRYLSSSLERKRGQLETMPDASHPFFYKSAGHSHNLSISSFQNPSSSENQVVQHTVLLPMTITRLPHVVLASHWHVFQHPEKSKSCKAVRIERRIKERIKNEGEVRIKEKLRLWLCLGRWIGVLLTRWWESGDRSVSKTGFWNWCSSSWSSEKLASFYFILTHQ